MSAAAHNVRLRLDQDRAPSLNGDMVKIWRGKDVAIDFAAFLDSAPITLDNVTSVTLRVKASQTDTGATLITSTVASFGTPTASTWAAGTAEHGTFSLTDAETNLDLSNAESGEYWYSVEAILDDGTVVIFGAGKFVVFESNATASGDPAAYPETVLGVAAGDARYVRTSGDLMLRRSGNELEVSEDGGATWTHRVRLLLNP